MPLSDEIIEASTVPSGQTQLKISDGGGLYLLVKHSGCYWKLAYRFEGKQKSLSFGVYPSVSIEKARAKRYEAKHLLSQNIDPGMVKKQGKQAVQTTLVNVLDDRCVEMAPKVTKKTVSHELQPEISKVDLSVAEKRRLKILQIIANSNAYLVNEINLLSALGNEEYKVSFDRLRTDIAWLLEQQVLTLEIGSVWTVRLTQYGLDVVGSRTWVPGINRT